MINNTQPVRLTYQSSLVGYSRGVFYHSGYSDQDVVGKAFWIDGALQPTTTNLDYLYLEVKTFQPNTEYTLESTFYDSMVDAEMLQNRSMVSISDPLTFSTKIYPSITGYTVTSENVTVGVAPPILNLSLVGDADSVEVQWSPTGEGDWVPAYIGPLDPSIAVAGISPGTIDVRVRGTINIPDGLGTRDISTWYQIDNILLDWNYSPPSSPTNLTFTTALLAEPSERYDVQVSWDWAKASGPDLREFVLYRIPTSVYNANPTNNKWAGASKVNTGTAQSYVEINHPFKQPMKYMVAAVAWGPTEDNTSFSTISNFEIDDNTTIDNDFTTQTGVEVTYAHIKGLLNDGGTWKQTFLVDAATGNVSIGLLDGQGQAPITFDATSGLVNVKGSVISEEIVAANFVLANLTGADNPKIYTTSKPNYGDSGQGMFAGYDGVDFKFDLGDSQKYIRWDGDKLKISGDVVIGTPEGDVPIGDGSVFIAQIFRNSSSVPSTPTSVLYPPSGWSKTPVGGSGIEYVSVGRVSNVTGDLVSGESWGAPIQFTGKDGIPGQDGTNGQTTYFHTAYADTSTGGGFSFDPTGKSYIGTYTDFNQGGSSNPDVYTWLKTEGIQGKDGTDGIPGSDGADGQTSYLHISYADTVSGGGFSQSPTDKEYIGQYVDFIQQDSTDPDDYTWALIKGSDGEPGQDGPKGDEGERAPNFYSQSLSGFSTWDASNASLLFTQLFGAGATPVPYDVLTQFNSSDPSVFETRQWNGTTWVTASQTIHGNVIVDGSIRAETMIADSAFLQTVGASEIYNDDAFVNGTPEADYTMKISLAGGYIHIR